MVVVEGAPSAPFCVRPHRSLLFPVIRLMAAKDCHREEPPFLFKTTTFVPPQMHCFSASYRPQKVTYGHRTFARGRQTWN